ncbi:hypothetical protein PAPYR_10660 [Paratrimastix pyriformis]|uniref:Uncharacterized protein n=1 Tax=Paratrimastix pyriformis TaxID=342808 RepID=A0ABQ8U985_9EUKA|nr:hypothetical protein PAPYR_10660 [Paratrimastix pyriformis]
MCHKRWVFDWNRKSRFFLSLRLPGTAQAQPDVIGVGHGMLDLRQSAERFVTAPLMGLRRAWGGGHGAVDVAGPEQDGDGALLEDGGRSPPPPATTASPARAAASTPGCQRDPPMGSGVMVDFVRKKASCLTIWCAGSTQAGLYPCQVGIFGTFLGVVS